MPKRSSARPQTLLPVRQLHICHQWIRKLTRPAKPTAAWAPSGELIKAPAKSTQVLPPAHPQPGPFSDSLEVWENQCDAGTGCALHPASSSCSSRCLPCWDLCNSSKLSDY